MYSAVDKEWDEKNRHSLKGEALRVYDRVMRGECDIRVLHDVFDRDMEKEV